MLKILRKKGVAKVLTWIIAIVIIISFGFMATAYLVTGNNSGGNYAGIIFGKKISYADFDEAYRDTVVDAMMQYGNQFNQVRSYLDLDAQTWDRLILQDESNKERITVTDAEVVETIQGYSFFQRDGQFDSLLYRDTMKFFFRIKDRDFEEIVRDKIRFAKLYDQVVGDITATEEEVLNAFRKQNERIQTSYILVSPEKFKDQVSVTDEMIKTYYDENPEQFRVPSSINVEYITLPFPPTPEVEVPAMTADNATEEPIESSEVEEATEALKETVRTQAADIFEALLIDPKFEAMAEKQNVEVKKSGFFSQTDPNLSLGWPFESLTSIFKLDIEEISEPFETSNGMVIAKIKERRDSYIPEYQDTMDKVKDAVINQEARRIASSKADEYLEAVKMEMGKTQTDNFTEAAKELGLEIDQTPVFTAGQYLPKLGIANEFQRAAFNLTETENISPVVRVTNGYAIIHLDGKEPADESTYEEQREEIADNVINQRKNQAFTEFMTNLRLQANLEDNISKLRQQQELAQ